MQRQVQFEERDFFKDRLTRDEIADLLGGRPASEMFNFRSPSFAKLGMQRDSLADDDLIELMLKEPRLVRRPVVRIGNLVHFSADTRVLETLLT